MGNSLNFRRPETAEDSGGGGTEETRYITKKNFLDHFKRPRALWFLQGDEITDFFGERMTDGVEELEDLYCFLREIDSDEYLIRSNFLKLSKILREKLMEAYGAKFNLPNSSVRDQSSVMEDRTASLLELIENSRELFLYNPTLICGDLKACPTALYKHGGKVYLLEHFWATALRREWMGTLIFNNYVVEKCLGLRVDQHLISYLSPEPSPDGRLMLEFTNCLPHKTKRVHPTGLLDKRLSNVNSYFRLAPLPYGGSLYETLFTREIYDELSSRDWPVDDPISPEAVVKSLRNFLAKEDRTIDFPTMARDFLNHKSSIVPSESAWFKFIFSRLFDNFTFSGNLLKFDAVLRRSLLYRGDTREKIRGFLDRIGSLPFLDFPPDQDYVVFEEAVSRFEDLKSKDIKVYYDFETISFPYPYLENTKPFAQLVLQLSLIRTRNGAEEAVENLIIDPLTLKVDDFRRIIDLIHTDEPNGAYIVYNKAFENSRLREMAELIGEDEYRRKVTSIISATIDLADWFSFGNSPFIIHRKLQGFHSIKKVIKLVSEDMERRSGAVQYSDLKRCRNGLMAQSLLMHRALTEDPKGDGANWEKNKGFMCKYCENDVRSMMAVEFLIEKLLRENRYGFYDFGKYVEDKGRFKKSFSIT